MARWRGMAVVLALAVGETAAAKSLELRIYPLDGESRAAAEIADAQALLASAIPTAARRSERLVAGEPLVMSPRCGRSPAPRASRALRRARSCSPGGSVPSAASSSSR